MPSFDFNWQITYQLATPKLLPAGTKMEVIAHYDNSANNKSTRPDEGSEVGDQTWEEMMIGQPTVVDPPPATAPRSRSRGRPSGRPARQVGD